MPVATKLTSNSFDWAPIPIQLVVPNLVIVYDLPITKFPASTVHTPSAVNEIPSVAAGVIPRSIKLCRAGVNSDQYNTLVMFIPTGTVCKAR